MHTTAVEKHPTSSKTRGGVVYRTSCQNPGCGHSFDLRITPENAGLLSGTMACPRCRRHGGMLKPQGRLGNKLFAAKLVFRLIGVAPRPDDDDVFAETAQSRY
jgi:hypothetical protein